MEQFSRFVSLVSVTQDAMIYDVALETLINCLTLLMCRR